MHLPISWWGIYKCTCPHCAECSAVLTQNNMTAVPHTPYSPDLTLSDTFYACFLGWKLLKRKHFADMEEVKQKTAEALKGIKIDEFKNTFEQWKKLINMCIASHGEYFEGDRSLKCRNKYTIFYKLVPGFWGFHLIYALNGSQTSSPWCTEQRSNRVTQPGWQYYNFCFNCQIWFRKLRRRMKVYYTYPYFCSSCLHSCLIFQDA